MTTAQPPAPGQAPPGPPPPSVPVSWGVPPQGHGGGADSRWLWEGRGGHARAGGRGRPLARAQGCVPGSARPKDGARASCARLGSGGRGLIGQAKLMREGRPNPDRDLRPPGPVSHSPHLPPCVACSRTRPGEDEVPPPGRPRARTSGPRTRELLGSAASKHPHPNLKPKGAPRQRPLRLASQAPAPRPRGARLPSLPSPPRTPKIQRRRMSRKSQQRGSKINLC